MRNFHTALEVRVDEDLLPLSALLHQRGVVHRIFEQNGRQVLEVERQDQVRPVAQLYRAWRDGEVRIELQGGRRSPPLHSAVNWRRAPVTIALILLSVAGFLLFYLGAPLEWLAALTFAPFEIVNGKPEFSAVEGQYWRLITPAFLHFGWLHIVFNSLWLWELGSRVEQVMGRINMLLLFLVIALVSNTAQFALGGPSLFGGMSGVVYGLLGFSWIAPLLQPRWAIRPATAIMVLMIGWLVACMLGLVEVLGFGAVANAAHVGGLLAGAALGAAFGWLSRTGGDPVGRI